MEIEFLYAFPGGALFQPVYKGLRTDKNSPDSYTSLKFKQAESERGTGDQGLSPRSKASPKDNVAKRKALLKDLKILAQSVEALKEKLSKLQA